MGWQRTGGEETARSGTEQKLEEDGGQHRKAGERQEGKRKENGGKAENSRGKGH